MRHNRTTHDYKITSTNKLTLQSKFSSTHPTLIKLPKHELSNTPLDGCKVPAMAQNSLLPWLPLFRRLCKPHSNPNSESPCVASQRDNARICEFGRYRDKIAHSVSRVRQRHYGIIPQGRTITFFIGLCWTCHGKKSEGNSQSLSQGYGNFPWKFAPRTFSPLALTPQTKKNWFVTSI